MFVLGGLPRQDSFGCLEGGPLQVFNLNTLKWQESYSPEVWSDYKVPKVVTDKINGKSVSLSSLYPKILPLVHRVAAGRH